MLPVKTQREARHGFSPSVAQEITVTGFRGAHQLAYAHNTVKRNPKRKKEQK
jgi:hypothetical protein